MRSPVSDVIREHEICSASYFKWKANYGGLDASELKRIKGLKGQLAGYLVLAEQVYTYRRLAGGSNFESTRF